MQLKLRLILAGISFIILSIAGAFYGQIQSGALIGLLFALMILIFDSEWFKEWQKREHERWKQERALAAEEAAVKREEALREIGRLEGRTEYNQQKMETLRRIKARKEAQKRFNRLIWNS